jgi:hypothetical protein
MGSGTASHRARHLCLQHNVVAAPGIQHCLLGDLPSKSLVYGGGHSRAPTPPPRGPANEVICSINISSISGDCSRCHRQHPLGGSPWTHCD